jgi:filamentous hemagglutinin family protein
MSYTIGFPIPPGIPVNHIYRIVWNASKHIWQVVSELGSKRTRTSSGRARRRRLALLALAAAGASAHAADLPTAGRVVAGQATFDYAGNTLTVRQGSNKAAIDWTGFSIGQGHTVNFVQPSASAVALNRVLGTDPSIIQGALNANGHVFLLNPNGVLFSPTAQVNVGGLLASTLAMSNEDFVAGRYHLSGTSAQAVENRGSIAAGAGGNVALVAARVVNTGSIAADQGNVLLGAGSDAIVDFGGPVKLQVNKGALDALVDNGGAIRADGGTVLMTAKSAAELSSSVINNSGVVQARTLATGAQGQIMLLGDMQSGTASVGGTLDASAPAGGNGGAIETSAAHVQTAPGLVVDAGAAAGKGGAWLVDPFNYVITVSGAATIANTLNHGTSVTVSTQQVDFMYGTLLPGLGDITVTSPIAKTAGGDATLTLRADRNITVGADITSTSGKLNMTLSAANAVGATTGGVDVNGNLKSNGGDILIGGGTGSTASGIGYARNLSGAGAAVTVETARSILSTGGNITINGKSTVGSSSGSYGGTTAGVYIKSDATILSGSGNLLINGESAGGTHTFGIAFQAAANTLTTVGSAPGGGTMLLNAVNSTLGDYTADDLAQGAIGLTAYGSRDRIAFQGPSVAAWLVYVNGAPQLSAYTQAPQLSSCATPYPNCGVLVVPGSNNSYLYATYQAVDMSTMPLYVINPGNGSKVYDGSAVATGLAFTTLGGPNGFTLGSLTPAPAYRTASKNVGTYVTLTADAGNPTDYTAGGTQYAIGYFSTGTYAITPKTLTPSAADKVYDGTTTAALALAGAVAGDDLTASGNGSFAAKDVGTYSVSISNIVLGGRDAQNYTLAGNTASAMASITPRTVSLNAAKTYDGSAVFGGVTLGNLVAGEDLVASGIAANSADVATARWISAATLSDGQTGLASNYRLPDLTQAGIANTATITPKALTLTGLAAADKVYDGTTAATLTGGTLSGLVGSEQLGVSGLTGVFADRNVGTGKAVSLSGATLADGTGLASNYTLAAPSSLAANITPKALTVSGITASGKTYDGTTAATVSTAGMVLQGLVAGDTVTVGATGTFADADAGAGKTVTLTSTHGGADAGNYTFADQATAPATIAPKALTIGGLGAANKTYDGTTAATLTGGSLVGLVGAETLDLSGLAGAFADKNVGIGKAVTISGGTLVDGTGRAANYSLTMPSGVTGTITQKALTVSGITAADKVYDGTTAATVSTAHAQLSGLVAGDDVTVGASGSFADANAGTGKTVALASTHGGADAGNYAIADQASATAAITPKALILTGLAAADKVYDGTTAATLTGGQLVGLVGAETLVVTGLGGTFADKNVGSGKTVSLSGGVLADGTGRAANYSLAVPASVTGTITHKALTVSGITAADKVYDGTTAATVSTAHAQLSGLVAGDDVTVGASGSFADANAGTGKTVALASTHGGADAGNYAIADQASATAAITSKALTLTGLAAADKVYDGTTAATLTGGQLVGLVGAETLVVTGLGGTFADKNVGSGKTVSLSGGVLADGTGRADNYSLAVPASVTGTITQKALPVSGITAADKVYDGTTAATVSATGAVVQGVVAGDDVRVASTGTFADKNAGSAKTVTLANTYGGADAGNYAIAGQSSATASITPKVLTVSGITAADKVYDGTTAATVSTTGAVVQGLVAGDDVRVTSTGTFADKNAGNAKTVTLANTYGGTDVGNYAIEGQSSATASITQKALTVSGITAADKVYDGTTAATVSSASAVLAGLVEGDSVTVAAQGTFADKNAGSGKVVDLTGTLGGADVGNYTTDMQRTATASIAQKTVTVTGAAVADKTADGTTAATLTAPGTLIGTIAGDSVTVNTAGADARFAQATAGTGIAVDVRGLGLSGPDASNYAFTGQTATTGTIVAATPAPVVPPTPAPEQTPAAVAATTIAPQALGLAPVLPAPAVGGLAYLAVPDAATATTGAAGAAGSVGTAVPAADGQGGEAGEGTTAIGATNRRQSASQALSAGRDVRFLNVLVVSGGIRMPAAGSGEAGGTEAPTP